LSTHQWRQQEVPCGPQHRPVAPVAVRVNHRSQPWQCLQQWLDAAGTAAASTRAQTLVAATAAAVPGTSSGRVATGRGAAGTERGGANGSSVEPPGHQQRLGPRTAA
jgi:hypothetical protein